MPAVSRPGLGPGDVHVWVGPLRGDASTALLSRAEVERANALLTDGLRRRFMIARTLLREVLAGYVGCDPAHLVIEADGRGKPFLRGHDLRFNMSRTDRTLVCAVAAGFAVGVDVETLDRLVDAEAITRAALSPEEQRRLRAYPESEREGALLRSWVRKEAILKAMGCGLSLDPRTIETLGDASDLEMGVRSSGAGAWFVHDLPSDSGEAAALATRRHHLRVRILRIPTTATAIHGSLGRRASLIAPSCA